MNKFILSDVIQDNAKLSVSSVVRSEPRDDIDAALTLAQSPVLTLGRDGMAHSHSMGQALVTATVSNPRHNVQTTALFIQVQIINLEITYHFILLIYIHVS